MNNQFPFQQDPQDIQGFPSIEGQQFENQQLPGSMMPSFGQQQFPGGMMPSSGQQQFSGGIMPSFGQQQFPGSVMPSFGQQQFPGGIFPPFGQQQFPGNIFPPFGQQGPSFPPSFPPGGQQQGAPTSPPPSFVPQRQNVGIFAVDPGSIRGCLFRFTYVWLNNGNSFWLYPIYVGRRSISGYRWNGFRWTYYGTDLERISSFQCY